MNDIITATMTSADGIRLSQNIGYTGEHNARMLQIVLNEAFALGDYDYITLRLDTGPAGETLRSNHVIDENSDSVYRRSNIVYCPLGPELTETGSLEVRVMAHKEDANSRVVRMSEPFTIYFRASVGPRRKRKCE